MTTVKRSLQITIALSATTALAQMRLTETGGGSEYVGFQAPASIAANLVWTLPNADGGANQCLATDGSGTLFWRSTGGGGGNSLDASDGSPINSVYVDASGNVGIGKTNPGQTLDVNGTARATNMLIGANQVWHAGNFNPGSYLTGESDTLSSVVARGASTSTTVTFGSMVSTGLGVSAGDANIELGGSRTGSGNSFIDWHSASGTDFEFRVIRAGGANGLANIQNNGTGTFSLITNSNLNQLSLFSSGSVGINTSSASDTLTVGGVVQGTGWRGRAGTGGATSNVFNFHWTGATAQLWVDTVNLGNMMVSSDKRLKKDIAPLSEHEGLDSIVQLRPVTFYWKDGLGTRDRQYGFVAQDVQSVFPDLVINTGFKTEQAPDGIRRLEHLGLIAPIVKALQEIREWMSGTHERIARLESENAALKARLEAVESKLNSR